VYAKCCSIIHVRPRKSFGSSPNSTRDRARDYRWSSRGDRFSVVVFSVVVRVCPSPRPLSPTGRFSSRTRQCGGVRRSRRAALREVSGEQQQLARRGAEPELPEPARLPVFFAPVTTTSTQLHRAVFSLSDTRVHDVPVCCIISTRRIILQRRCRRHDFVLGAGFAEDFFFFFYLSTDAPSVRRSSQSKENKNLLHIRRPPGERSRDIYNEIIFSPSA